MVYMVYNGISWYTNYKHLKPTVQEKRLHELQQQREELTRLSQEASRDAREAATLEAEVDRFKTWRDLDMVI